MKTKIAPLPSEGRNLTIVWRTIRPDPHRYPEAARRFRDVIAKGSNPGGQGNRCPPRDDFACAAAAANRPDHAPVFARDCRSRRLIAAIQGCGPADGRPRSSQPPPQSQPNRRRSRPGFFCTGPPWKSPSWAEVAARFVGIIEAVWGTVPSVDWFTRIRGAARLIDITVRLY
jgi:hypothetical protein